VVDIRLDKYPEEGMTDPQWWIDNCLSDLFFLCKQVLHHGKTKEYRDLNWVHLELCDFLDMEKNLILQKLVLMFRDGLKSSMARAFAIQWFLKKARIKDTGAIFILSGISDLAEDHLDKIVNEIIGNELLQAYFHDCLPQKKSDFDICDKEKIRYKGIEIDIGSEDKSLTGHHYEGGIVDNWVNELNSSTPERRKKLIKRWQQSEALLAEKAWELIFETTWAIDDLSGIILNPEGKFDYSKIKNKPAYRFISDMGYAVFSCPSRDEKGNPVFPEKTDEEYLARKRSKMGYYLYSALYDLQPIPDEEIKFKGSWITHYGKLPDNFIRNMVIDCAGSLDKNSPYSAISLGDWDEYATFHIPFAEKRRLTPYELLEWVIAVEQISKDEGRPIFNIGVEKEKYGIFLGSILDVKRPDLTIIRIPIKGRPRDNRISSLVPYYEGGKILSKPGLTDYEDEVRTYYKGKQAGVDILDTIFYHFEPVMKYIPKKLLGVKREDLAEDSFRDQLKRDRIQMNPRMRHIASNF